MVEKVTNKNKFVGSEKGSAPNLADRQEIAKKQNESESRIKFVLPRDENAPITKTIDAQRRRREMTDFIIL